MTRPKKSLIAQKKNAALLNEKHKKGSKRAIWRAQKFSKQTKTKKDNHNLVIEAEKSLKYYVVDNGCELKSIIIGVLKHDYPLMACNHFLVGSSRIADLLSGTLSPRKIHSYFITHSFRKFGKIAEQAAQKKFDAKKPPCKVSGQLPFICAAPDILLSDRLIEVKSSNVIKKISSSDILQLLVSLEIFGLKHGELHLYRSSGVYQPQTQLVEVVGIRKTSTLFIPEFIKYAIRGYLTYLTSLLNCLEIFSSEASKLEAANLLSTQATLMNSASVEAPNLSTGNLCHKFFPYLKMNDSTKYQPRNTLLWSESCDNSEILEADSQNKSKKEKRSSYYKDEGEAIVYDRKIYSNYVINPANPCITRDFYEKTNKTKLSDQIPDKHLEEIIVLPEDNVIYTSYEYNEASIEVFLKQFTGSTALAHVVKDFVFAAPR